MSLEWRLPGRDGLLPHRCRRLPTLSRGAYGGVSDFPPANRRWILRAAVSVLALVGFVLLLAGNTPRTAASQAEAPGVPQYVQISPGQSEELVVSWNAPASDGGSAITGYKVQWKEAAGSWDTPADVSETTVTGKTHTITGLTGGLEYAVRVIAVNDIGDGPPSSEETCPGGGYGPDPTPVEVDAVPIVIESTTADYFVLYVSHDVDGTEVELPVLVKRGQAGTTELAENVAALPKERYRVEKYLVADPADVDGDCIHDITELDDLGHMNPVNPAAAVALSDGTVIIPDQGTFETIAFASAQIKFAVLDMDTARPHVYFQNSKKHLSHRSFLDVIGFKQGQPGIVGGEIAYDPQLTAPDGSPGAYRLSLSRRVSYHAFGLVDRYYTLFAASMPLLDDNLFLRLPNWALPDIQSELPLYRESRIHLLFDEDILGETKFLELNPGEGYGLLRVMEPDDRPNPRDIVIYEALPNELPRVAGIISTVPQTPLSHVNLRAVQDGVPNSFIRDALDNTDIDDLVDSHVHYTVTEDGWTLRAATPAEVDAHYASSRPATEQTPQRDLSVTEITPLSEVGFEDWDAFGVKAANVAVLGTLGFPEGTVPDGFAVPFYFYDEFMKHNGFYDDIEEMLADPDFQTDFDVQEDELKDLRKAVKKGEMPEWITEELTDMHATYPGGQSLRYRSSTNNEDLPGFNGAGLYDSKTQHPEETEEDGIAKSLKQVYASLWNFRAFTERDFNRIDHLAAAMGVLVHPNYSDELANGVAVSFDPVRGQEGFYVNTQVGEDLITNPDAHSMPEEILLDEYGYRILATSNRVPPGQLLMSDDQMTQLYDRLTVVHEKFEELYSPAPGERFAMEVEFKITRDDILAVKQARPWVFSEPTSAVAARPNSPAIGLLTISGTARVGETLTGTNVYVHDSDGTTGAVFTYQWISNDENGDSDIVGITESNYTLVADDAGKTIEFRVSFTDDRNFEETLTSAPTDAVLAETVPGTPQHLKVSLHDTGALDVSWEAPARDGGSAVTGYRVQWKETAGNWDIPADVSEETVTGTTHTITGLTDGVEYAVRIIAANDVGEGPPSDEATGTPRETTPPELSTATVDGATLTLTYDEDLDENSEPSSDAFSVTVGGTGRAVDGVSVSGSSVILTLGSAVASGATVTVSYTVPTDAAALRIRDLAGNAAASFSDELVTNNTPKPNSPATGQPTITGTAQVGETLTADISGIGDDDGLPAESEFDYQWTRNDGSTDANIAGAVDSTYVLLAADVGKFIKVRVTFTDKNDYTETLTSAATSTVVTPLTAGFRDAPDKHLGTGVFTFDIAFSEPISIGYVTLRDDSLDVTNGSATKAKRVDGQSDLWKITIEPDSDADVTVVLPITEDCAAQDAVCTRDGTKLSNRSELTVPGPAAANTPATGLPTISGTAQVGETLTVDTSGIDDADGTGNATFSYQWIAGTTDISGATGSSYAPLVADLGKTIKVRVSFDDDDDNEETLTSEATATVIAAVTPLTAGFQDAPDKHLGTGVFTFEIAFSEPISISYKTLRDDSLEVTNGSATKAKRMDGQSNLWEITVEPDSDAAVTVVLPITEDCSTQGAVCSPAGGNKRRPLSNRSELTVPGPAAANSSATGAPIISGTAQVGETLTVDTSSIDDADGMSGAVFSYQWLANDAEITGATSDTYTLVEADVGKAVKVRVIFNDDDNNEETLTSEATAGVAAETAAPDAPRSLNVSPDDTGTLDASWEAPASDGGSDITGYKVQWKSGSEDYDGSAGSTRQAEITDPASRTHTITGLTDGVEYTVRVIAVNDVGDGPPSDEATGTPRETTPPELSTATVDGATLTLTSDEALDENSEPSPDAFSVNVGGTGRAVDGVSVSGSSVILTLGSAVASGTTVTVSYTAPADTAAPRIRDLAGNAAASFSNELVTNNTPKPNSPATGQPTITGTAQVGETLTMETSAIDDADGLDNVSYSYQWLANGADITGATSSSYTLVDADKGKTIQVKVSFRDDRNNQETLTSEATAAVEPRPNSPATGAPTISGTVRVGKTLTAETSDIADADGMSGAVFIYQWLADDADIAGATSDAYALVETDVGKAIKVKVSFRDDRNHQESLTSPATAAVTAAADESAVWSATLTVGSIGGFRGFWKDVGMGELTPEVFTLDGVDYTVKVLADSDGPQFYLTVDKALPVGFTLQVGATTLSSQGASIREFSSGATQYGWATNQEAILADVDTVEVSLTLAE